MSELEPDLLEETDLETLLYLIKNAPPNWEKNRLRVRPQGPRVPCSSTYYGCLSCRAAPS